MIVLARVHVSFPRRPEDAVRLHSSKPLTATERHCRLYTSAVHRTWSAMKTFISYSTAADQIVALRLQTLAAVYGMTVYVPPADTRLSWEGSLDPEVEKQLKTSDVVLAVITQVPSQSAINEMNAAIQYKRLLIPIVSNAVPPQYYGDFP